MRYLVTGATGLIGTAVVERLLEDGDDVVALTRSRSNATHLPDAVTITEGDITDRERVREAMADVDGVFHIAAWFYVGPGPRHRREAERTNVEGTRIVLEVMDELGVDNGVYTSTVGVYPSTDQRLDESVRPDCPQTSVYFRTKWEAHYEVARPMIERGLPLVIVQPGVVYGPGDKLTGSCRAMFRAYLESEVPMIARGVHVPFEYVDDTADAHVRAIRDGELGETYIIANEPQPMTEVFAVAESITGVPVPRAVSPRVFRVLAGAMGVAERVITPPAGFEPELLRFMAGTTWPVDNTKATAELGISHRPLEDGLREYLAWEMAEFERERTNTAEADVPLA